MQGRARGRKGERKTYHINPYHHITMEFGTYLLNVAKNPRAQERARAKRKGSYPTKKQQEFSITPMCCVCILYIHIIYCMHMYT